MLDSSGLVLVLWRVSCGAYQFIALYPAPSRPDPGLLSIIIFLLTLLFSKTIVVVGMQY